MKKSVAILLAVLCVLAVVILWGVGVYNDLVASQENV